MMPRIDPGKMDMVEFAKFVDAEPVSPRKETDEAVYRMASRIAKPAVWTLLARILFIQVSSGILTLAACPQFGIGSSTHNVFVHSLHSFGNPFLYYLSCGIFFVLIGAALNGLLSRRKDLVNLGRGRYAFFIFYSFSAFAVFAALGTEIVLAGALFWILGAVLGNVVGFEMGARLRQAAG
jgi:hypothetical protein